MTEHRSRVSSFESLRTFGAWVPIPEDVLVVTVQVDLEDVALNGLQADLAQPKVVCHLVWLLGRREDVDGGAVRQEEVDGVTLVRLREKATDERGNEGAEVPRVDEAGLVGNSAKWELDRR